MAKIHCLQHNNEAFDVERIEEQAVQLVRDLIIKKQKTLNVLKELEAAKRFVEGLKLSLVPNMSSLMEEGLGSCPCPVVSPGLMFNELSQAKLNLSRMSGDLAAIQASVESLNKKLRQDKNGGEGNVQKQYFMQRKKFGFIQVPIPTMISKKKGQPIST